MACEASGLPCHCGFGGSRCGLSCITSGFGGLNRCRSPASSENVGTTTNDCQCEKAEEDAPRKGSWRSDRLMYFADESRPLPSTEGLRWVHAVLFVSSHGVPAL